jgi:hypothetical protein
MSTPDFHLAPDFLLRVAGLPADALDGLRAPRSTAWAREALELEETMALLAPRAGDVLAEAVARTERPALRRRLLALRRDIHNARTPALDAIETAGLLGTVDSERAAGIAEPAGAADAAQTPQAAGIAADAGEAPAVEATRTSVAPGTWDAAQLSGADPAARPVRVDTLTTWLELRRRYDQLLDGAESTLAGDLGGARAHLRALAEDPALRAGIQAASTSLNAALPAYVAERGPGAPPHGKLRRKTERSLLAYVYRAAVKTSPFSTLTPLARGRFRRPDDAPDATPATASGAVPGTAPGAALSLRPSTPPGLALTVRPNLTAVHEITGAALSDPATRAVLPFRAVSGRRYEDERVHYVRRRYRAPEPGLTIATPGVLKEELFQLAAGPVLKEALALLDATPAQPPNGTPGGMTLPQLADTLHLADPERRPREQLDVYLARLVDLGLLATDTLVLDIHHPDPVADLAARLRAVGAVPADRLADRLDRLRAHVDAYPLTPHGERARRTAALRAETAEAQRELGRTEPVVPRTAVYEDAVLTATGVASLPAWEHGPLPALRRFARVLPAFDLLLADRLLARGRFRVLYGPGGVCEDVPGFAKDLQTTCGKWLSGSGARLGRLARDGTYEPRPNPYDLPEVEALDAAHRVFATALQDGLRQLPDGADELLLDDDTLDRVAALLPDGPHSQALPCSHSFYLQWAGPGPQPEAEAGAGGRDAQPQGRRPLAVLNWAYTGMGQPVARFARSFGPETEAELTDGIRRRHERLLPTGAVFADLSGGYDTSNLSLRPALAPYRLTGPAEAPLGPANARVPLSDLTLVDDEESGELQLRSRRLGVRVIPLYLGGLIPMALPLVQRALLAVSPVGMPLSDVWAGVAAAPRHRPRVRHGDLVLSRRSWRFAREELPAPARGADTVHGFLDRRRWWRGAGLPSRVVVRTRGAKPLPVDADSPLSLALCDHALRTGDTGESGDAVFSEMLPDLTELPLRAGGSAYVSELCAELDRYPHHGRTTA